MMMLWQTSLVCWKLTPIQSVYIERGNTYDNTGNHDLAIADYNTALSLNPNDVLGYYNRGLSYFRQERFAEAIQDCEQAVRLDPTYSNAYLVLGDSYSRTGIERISTIFESGI